MNAGVCTAASTSPLASTWLGLGLELGVGLGLALGLGLGLGLGIRLGSGLGLARQHLVPRCGVVGAQVLAQPGVARCLGRAADDHLVSGAIVSTTVSAILEERPSGGSR